MNRVVAPIGLQLPRVVFGKVQKQVTPEGVAGVDTRRVTPPDLRLPRRGLAGLSPARPQPPSPSHQLLS
ncbi:MAG TPA: hypothetical protein VHS97_19470, partial [Isosphaeraceae bacterium]|nr:hypothetical protein [Isosphaeraceae bacterium]